MVCFAFGFLDLQKIDFALLLVILIFLTEIFYIREIGNFKKIFDFYLHMLAQNMSLSTFLSVSMMPPNPF